VSAWEKVFKEIMDRRELAELDRLVKEENIKPMLAKSQLEKADSTAVTEMLLSNRDIVALLTLE
jgi:hypothetical protein